MTGAIGTGDLPATPGMVVCNMLAANLFPQGQYTPCVCGGTMVVEKANLSDAGAGKGPYVPTCMTYMIERKLISLANDVSSGGINIDPSDLHSSVVR